MDLLDLTRSGTRDVSPNYIGWIEAILRSGHSMEARRHSVELFLQLLGRPESPRPLTTGSLTYQSFYDSWNFVKIVTKIIPFLPPCLRCSPSRNQRSWLFDIYDGLRSLALLLVSVFARVLQLDDRLQPRALNFELFAVLRSSWPFLPLYEWITPEVCARFVEAIENSLQLNESQLSAPGGEVKRVECPGCSCGVD